MILRDYQQYQQHGLLPSRYFSQPPDNSNNQNDFVTLFLELFVRSVLLLLDFSRYTGQIYLPYHQTSFDNYSIDISIINIDTIYNNLAFAFAPGVISCIRLRHLMRVVLSQPEGPINAVTVFSLTSRLMFFNACLVPNHVLGF